MKKYIKKSLIILIVCFSIFFGQQSQAAGTYVEEGVAFYAQINYSGYAAEGVAFYSFPSQQTGTIPIYRFVSTANGNHFYTASEDEKNVLLNNSQLKYNFEGISFYAFTNQDTQTNIDASPVYQFFNSSNSKHFYTSAKNEYDALISNPQWGFTFERVAFYSYSTQSNESLPIYRFFNSNTGDHFYTASEDEKNIISMSPVYRFYNNAGHHFYTAFESEKSILANTSRSGFVPEGIAFTAQTTQAPGTLPVYRFNNNAKGDHFYTAIEAEKNALINNPQSGYTYEGIVFYAPTTQLPGYYPVYRFFNETTNDHFYTVSESERYALLNPPIGPEIAVGLWGYSKADIQGTAFQIDANKPYNIRDNSGGIIAQVGASALTKVTYDADGNLRVYNSITSRLVSTSITFDATDGDNTSIVFNTYRSRYVSDWRGNIDRYRGKIKAQYYHGADIFGGNTGTTVQQVWIINTLPLEQYTWGTAETSGTGDINHTKVMTTAVRTYGYRFANMIGGTYAAYGFKIRSDSGSQNYGGYDWEIDHPNIRKAAEQTRGVLVYYAGNPVVTPYSSWSDGNTRTYGSSRPWCMSVSDPYGNRTTSSDAATRAMTTAQLLAAGNHMYGLVAWGSVHMAEQGWDWQNILRYYYTGINLATSY